MFPTIENWRRVIAPSDEQFAAEKFYLYYRGKYEIALETGPARIAEIGVRYGYSAFAFLSANPQAHYTGYDLHAGTHGGARANTFVYVDDMLTKHFPEARIELIFQDTREMNSLGGTYDFIHIDGDHSEPGCYHDLALAIAACRPGGRILIDDYTYKKGVNAAVDRFTAEHADRIAGQELRPSIRGEYIIDIKE